ncbi:MAG: DUF2793 domain-containing protein [Acidobacteria bacterium]|nr:DUF2793 domain-containing protein [Acidobacteriota bacterium]MBI3489716.1 DUF2793 domain-containing protein [Acidobacteriota bacterium]
MAKTFGPNLGLLVDAAQGEAHYAELMKQWRGLDGLVMPCVNAVGKNTPPVSPMDGAAYIVGPSSTGAWASKNNQIARWSSVAAAWEFFIPKTGWRVVDSSDPALPVWSYTGSGWTGSTGFSGSILQAGSSFGRFEGLFTTAPPGASGVGIEVGNNGGIGRIASINRTLSSNAPLQFAASSYDFQSGLATFGYGVNFGQTDLKNYQEGTWTPTPVGLTTTGSPTYTGRYTRIGRFCLVSVVITPNGGTVAATANTSYFSGLPFTVLSSSPAPAADAAVGSYSQGVANGTNLYLPTMPSSNLNRFVSSIYEI